jgi:hypothetical protein
MRLDLYKMIYEFILYKNTIFVDAIIKGINVEKELRFILDTGASGCSIDKNAISHLNFDYEDLADGGYSVGVGGRVKAKVLELPQLSLFGKTLNKFKMRVIDYPTQITCIASGLIGMDFLLNFETLKFDFVNEFVEVSSKKKVRRSKKRNPSNVVLTSADLPEGWFYDTNGRLRNERGLYAKI